MLAAVVVILCSVSLFLIYKLFFSKGSANKGGVTIEDRPFGALYPTEGLNTEDPFPVTARGVKIGRDPEHNDIVVDNEGVSREHAWIGILNGIVVVRDLDSMNGTFVNSTEGERAIDQPIQDGDAIIVGKGRFVVLTYRAATGARETSSNYQQRAGAGKKR